MAGMGAYDWGNNPPSQRAQSDEGMKDMPAWQKFAAGGAGVGSMLGGDGGAAIGALLPLLLQAMGKGDVMDGLMERLGSNFQDKDKPENGSANPMAALPADPSMPMMAPGRDPRQALMAMGMGRQ